MMEGGIIEDQGVGASRMIEEAGNKGETYHQKINQVMTREPI